MDWSRAKTILILAFVVLNLFLGSQLSQSMRQKSEILHTSKVTEQQVNQLLKENQIQYVTKDKPYPDQIGAYQAAITSLHPEWKQDEEGGHIKNYSPAHPYKNRQDLERFLKREIPFFTDYRFESSSSKKIVYLQHDDNGRPIFDGKVEVNLASPGRIGSIRVVHYTLTQLQAVKLIDPYSALYRLITNWGPQKNSIITEPNLGYRAKAYTSREDYILIPYWRFKVGQVPVYINATQRGLSEDVETAPDTQTDSKGTK